MTRLGVALPQLFPNDPVDIRLVRSFAALAEQRGFADLWAMEELVGRIGGVPASG